MKFDTLKPMFLSLLVLGWLLQIPARLAPQAFAWTSAQMASIETVSQDPNKAPSEANHHLIGYVLIALGVMAIAGQYSDRLRWLRFVWPFLFIAAGLFLAAWSDAEMWPRGNLSWTWLVHHDPEARQHKIYAILLMALGTIEYFRARARLSGFWQTWAFALLAFSGSILLFFHDHGAGGGGNTLEAQKYVISWLAPSSTPTTTASVTIPDDAPAMHNHRHMMPTTSASNPAVVDPTSVHMHGDLPGQPAPGHHHSPAMMKIEQEHLWFALVGMGVIVFKFLDDGAFLSPSWTAHLWPGCMVALGVLLVIYAE